MLSFRDSAILQPYEIAVNSLSLTVVLSFIIPAKAGIFPDFTPNSLKKYNLKLS